MRFSALFAILALIGMVALAYWHDAMPHVHDIDHIVSIDPAQHEHAPRKTADSADLMHMAAHAVLQTIDVPAPPVLADMIVPIMAIWTFAPAETGRASTPQSILRPPQG
jgi:hypothetical protein